MSKNNKKTKKVLNKRKIITSGGRDSVACFRRTENPP